MNQIQQHYNSTSIQRRALIDSVMTEHYQVENPVAVATMLECMSSQDIRKIFNCLNGINDNVATKVLNELLVQKNNSTNTAIVVNESVWKEQRNSILLKEDSNSGDMTSDQLAKIISHATLKVSLATIITVYFTKENGPHIVSAAFTKVGEKGNKVYKAFRLSLVRMKKLKLDQKIKAASPQERLKLIKKAHSVILPDLASNAELAKQWLVKDIPATGKIAAKQKLIKNILGGVGSALKTSGKIALAVAGITGVYLLIHKIFNRMNIAAVKSCKGAGSERRKCILNYKINACNQIIAKLEEALPACKDKSDPQKCTLSIQKEIWFWNKKKAQYQEQLQKLSHLVVPSAFRQ